MELFGSAGLESEVVRAVRALEALGSAEALARAAALCESLEAYRGEAQQAAVALQGASQARREVRLALAAVEVAQAGAAGLLGLGEGVGPALDEARAELALRREQLRRAVAERDAAPFLHERARLRLRAALLEAEGYVQARALPGSPALGVLAGPRAGRQLH